VERTGAAERATGGAGDPAGEGGEGTAPPLPFTAADLGFVAAGDGAWRRRVGGRTVAFRLLRRLPDLLAVEGLQREVFGVTDRDLAAASQLVVVPETGGEVIGAYLGGGRAPETDPHPELVGFALGWGGYVAGRPRLVSDMLAVRGDLRGGGLGAELKRLQAAIALERGFGEIVWTVDPLRAANARLNFEKLGAYADRYEEDRYGADYGAGLYGGLPSDRLHVTWPLTSPRVRDRLLGRAKPTAPADVAGLGHFDPAADAARALVFLPSDVDLLRVWDPNATLRWRLTLREALTLAFARGYAITGFVADADKERGHAAYVIERGAVGR
jgi:predicted GNAT superfamily acetyltransferase